MGRWFRHGQNRVMQSHRVGILDGSIAHGQIPRRLGTPINVFV
jgi:hypothetical protein